MAEHLDAYQFALRSADMLLFYLAIDFCHLFHLQFSSQHHYIGKLSVELQGLYIRDVELCREVYLHAHLATVGHYGYITSDNCRNLCFDSSIYYLVHGLNVLTIDNGIYSEIGFYASLVTGGGNIAQVVNRKVIGGV